MSILVFGHKNPDTDSVSSAIAFSYLNNKLGQNTEATVLGNISKETKYVLDYFKIEEPRLINNVKIQLEDLELEKVEGVKEDTSILSAFKLMEDGQIKVLPILDSKQHLKGVVTMKDIAMALIKSDGYKLSTTLNSIANDLKGNILVKAQENIEGNIKIASLYHETLQGILTSDDIIITGDRYDVFEEAIKLKVKLIIVTGGVEVPEEYLKSAKENGVSVISVGIDTFTSAKLINQCNNISSIMNTNIIKFSTHEYLEDVKEKIEQTNIRSFPVIDCDNVFLGFVSRSHIISPQRKKVMLVDHNEYEQSAEGLKEAEIIEVVDHHKIGNISTSMPISFRNMPVGSTCTIIYTMFKQANIEIPHGIAGVLISGIISDTLLFKSPTTTDIDKDAVENLNKILKLDLEKYAMDMFKSGTSLEGYSIEEIFYRDFKQFEIEGQKIGVGQVFTLDIDDVFNRKDKFLEFIDKTHEESGYYITLLVITDILKEGSYILYKSSKTNLIQKAFNADEEQGVFIPGLVSRKKQVVPNITEALNH
ncbi:manganese-dependent inorganic pyrophosphatase PpaC [Gottschalkia acidurici 9a]|uniref:inorganic diphosphatase n=1 Tax=Gottschalkia acidurici (strain ATCC 7906 / DSM 604 / BCRC 14475 / CIP 104303 / KCTC 5404 / NCIMB 10678 / 9a) TaxID=1128398 RepID=K0B3F1_GOTA9|nr:putative manganese-dependent inorganic diphosphatase [Gottschalkia acidurici]AFS79151.1 manganese-dependent inorganic pyrophosphatase PpaC [Gottschalkia acidurici 9a]